MVPLYAARVQDLGTGDVVVFRCGACRHTAELPLSALLARAWAEIHRKGTRPGAAVAMPAMLRERASCCVAQVAGVDRRAQRAVGVNGRYLIRPVCRPTF